MTDLRGSLEVLSATSQWFANLSSSWRNSGCAVEGVYIYSIYRFIVMRAEGIRKTVLICFFFWRLPLPESACSWCKPVSGYWNLSQLPGRETPKCLECSERIQAFPQRVPCGEAFSVVRVLSQSLDTSTGMMVVWTCSIMKRSISDISEGRKDFRNQKLSSLAPVQLHTVMGSSGEALCDVTIPKLQNHPGQTQQYYQHLGGAEIKTPNLVSLQLWREICCCKMCTYSIWFFENRRF